MPISRIPLCITSLAFLVLSSAQLFDPSDNNNGLSQLGNDFQSNISQRQNPFGNGLDNTRGFGGNNGLGDQRFGLTDPRQQQFDPRLLQLDPRLRQQDPRFSQPNPFQQQNSLLSGFQQQFGQTDLNGFNRPVPQPTLVNSNGQFIEPTDPRILPSFGGPPQFGNLAPSSHVLTSFLGLDSDQIDPRPRFQQSLFNNGLLNNPLLTNQFRNPLAGNQFGFSQFGNQPGFNQIGNQLGFSQFGNQPGLSQFGNNQLGQFDNGLLGNQFGNRFGNNPLLNNFGASQSNGFNNQFGQGFGGGLDSLLSQSNPLSQLSLLQQRFQENLIPPFVSPLQQFLQQQNLEQQLQLQQLQRQQQLQNALQSLGSQNSFQSFPLTQLIPRASFQTSNRATTEISGLSNTAQIKEPMISNLQGGRTSPGEDTRGSPGSLRFGNSSPDGHQPSSNRNARTLDQDESGNSSGKAQQEEDSSDSPSQVGERQRLNLPGKLLQLRRLAGNGDGAFGRKIVEE